MNGNGFERSYHLASATQHKNVAGKMTFYILPGSRLCIFASFFFALSLSLWIEHIKSAKEWIAQCLAAIALKFTYTHIQKYGERVNEKKERNKRMKIGVIEYERERENERDEASARRNSNFMFPFFERNIITENKRKYYKLEINLLQRLFWWHQKMKEKWKNKVFFPQQWQQQQ